MRVWIAIWTGSSLICRAIAGWLLGGGAVVKLAVVTLAAGFVKGLPWTTNIAAACVFAWLALAIALGLRAPGAATTPADPAGEQQPVEPMLPTREELATALHEIADPHVHLKPLAAHLKTSPQRLREALDAASIPVSGGVRMAGRVSTGVKADHFPPLPAPGETAAVAVVGAGQSNNNNDNNAEVEFEQDEKNPHRWRVLRRA